MTADGPEIGEGASDAFPTPTVVKAGELHAGHIGEYGRWYWFDSVRRFSTVITAEIRQISHDGDVTHLTYGQGAEREITLEHSHPVVLGPAGDYTDFSKFIVNASPYGGLR